jgi:hypothetical protein
MLRCRETVGIYTYVKPKNQREQDYNEKLRQDGGIPIDQQSRDVEQDA